MTSIADVRVTGLGSNDTTTLAGRSIGFVDAIAARGDDLAVVDHDGTAVSYRALDGLVARAEARLGSTRRLVLIPAANRLTSVVWYLAALRSGHVTLLTGSASASVDRMIDRYDPDVVIDPDADALVHERRAGTRHDLHPDLALLLSTSGSTGSAKLVRLSRANVSSNAAAIAEALGLRDTDRAITALPLHYCYGLSVLHSHLQVGGAIVLTDASVVDPCFWAAFDRHGVTNLAGVPHVFDLLERSSFDARRHPTLRLVTQAGGRLAPARVRHLAETGRAQGFDFVVMYGQTEATARIAVLAPDRALTDPGAAGTVIPGGRVRIDPVDDGDRASGELVYTGPNVMMGYATRPCDLARPAEVTELRTGDIARIDGDGLIEIVGRRAEFLKLFGLRIDLREVERTVDDLGVQALVGGDDDGLVVAITGSGDPSRTRRALADQLGIPPLSIAVARIDEPPRLENGKLDRPSLAAEVRAASPGGPETTPSTPDIAPVGPVASLYGAILGTAPRSGDDTFVSLGGDSLSYVELSIRLEGELGHLPDAWHLATIDELERGGRPRGRWSHIETNVAIRAVAIVLIVANHTGAFLVGGGAHVLLGAAGYNVARFQVGHRPPWRSVLRLAMPAVAWIGIVAATTDDFDLAHALLVHGWVGGRGRWAYWFVEVLVQLLVAVSLLVSIPSVRRVERRHPIGFPAVLAAGALAVRFDLVDLGSHHRMFFRPHEIAWIFLIGWMAERADDDRSRMAVSAVVMISVPGFFGDPTREAVLAVGLLALLWVRRVPVPRAVASAAGVLAAASLWIYLTHYQVHPLLSDDHPWVAIAVSVAVGVAAWRTVDPSVSRLERAITSRLASRPRSPAHERPISDTVGA